MTEFGRAVRELTELEARVTDAGQRVVGTREEALQHAENLRSLAAELSGGACADCIGRKAEKFRARAALEGDDRVYNETMQRKVADFLGRMDAARAAVADAAAAAQRWLDADDAAAAAADARRAERAAAESSETAARAVAAAEYDEHAARAGVTAEWGQSVCGAARALEAGLAAVQKKVRDRERKKARQKEKKREFRDEEKRLEESIRQSKGGADAAAQHRHFQQQLHAVAAAERSGRVDVGRAEAEARPSFPRAKPQQAARPVPVASLPPELLNATWRDVSKVPGTALVQLADPTCSEHEGCRVTLLRCLVCIPGAEAAPAAAAAAHADPCASDEEEEGEEEGGVPAAVQLASVLRLTSGTVVVLLSRGGSFAGGVFEGGECVVHKRFTRYVARAAQGGRQSAHEGRTDTAGSALRAHQERRFGEDIRDLLAAWSVHISAASAVLLHAPGPANRAPFFGAHGLSEHRRQRRLLSVPLSVRRPTYEEVQRVYGEVLQCRVHGAGS